MEVQSERGQSPEESGPVAFEQGEHGAAQFGRPLGVENAETFSYVPVGLPLTPCVVGRVEPDGSFDDIVGFASPVGYVVGW